MKPALKYLVLGVLACAACLYCLCEIHARNLLVKSVGKNQRKSLRDHRITLKSIYTNEDDFRQWCHELGKRSTKFGYATSRYLTNGITPKYISQIHDTNNFLFKKIIDTNDGVCAVLTKGGVFALFNTNYQAKFCEEINDWFRGSTVANVTKFDLESSNFIVIQVQYYSTDPIILGGTVFPDYEDISISMDNGYIELRASQ